MNLVLLKFVLMVLTTTASTAEAGKSYGIPASTIQPYVNRAKKAMEERGIEQIVGKNGSVDSCEASPGVATEEEIKDAVRSVIENGGSHSEARKEQLFAAVTAAVSGKVTIKEACHQVDLPPSTAHPYVSKARHLLGSRCPDRKGIVPTDQIKETPKSSLFPLKRKFKSEDDEVPLSVRGVSRMLCDTKFDVFATDFRGTKEDLKAKIGKIIQRYNYKGNRATMCDAIAKVFLEGRTLADVCASHSLAQTTLSTYVREIICLSLTSYLLKIEKENEDLNASDEKTKGAELSNSVSTKLIKAELDTSHPADDLVLKKEENVEMNGNNEEDDSLLLETVDVAVLHSKPVLESQERLLKLTIAYLIKQQYRRSADAQEKMRICLEDVLLDGLSVNETLKIHKGPTDHVLQVYLTRVRGAQKCIMNEYQVFLEEKVRCVKECDFARLVQNKPKKIPSSSNSRQTRRTSTPTNSATSSPTTRRSAKRIQPEDGDSAASNDALSYLNNLLSEVALKAMVTYLSKLHDINFPIENALLLWLAKATYEEIPSQYQNSSINSETWDEWVISWRRKHAMFDE
uniref:HTH psq-type domain-containing protein n=1 Tax=Syphacia muris TaxID=451379 RepID=A0A0N5AXD3_9BILA